MFARFARCTRAVNAIFMLKLSHGLSFPDLYGRDGLLKLDAAFLRELAGSDALLCERLLDARGRPDALPPKQESELLIALAPHVDDFVAGLFGIEAEVQQLAARHNELTPLYSCKRLFVQRKAMHKFKADDALKFDGAALESELSSTIASAAGACETAVPLGQVGPAAASTSAATSRVRISSRSQCWRVSRRWWARAVSAR